MMSLKQHIAFIRHGIVILITSLFPYIIYSQTYSPTEITDIAEDLAMEAENRESITSIFETLMELSENPVAINSADEAELSQLFFLSGYQIKSLLYHIQTTGKIASVYEIASIPGFDRQTTETMLPFITLDYLPTTTPTRKKWRSELITNVSLKPGERDSTLLGSHMKVLAKYKLVAGNYQAGFTAEKDAGETFMTGKPKTPDFLSGYVSYKSSGVIRSIVAGDYSLKFGQGTNVNTGFGTALSLTGANMITGRDEIKPYTSTNENNFFRGIATEMAIGRLSTTIFFSNNQQDATIDYSAVDDTYFVKNDYASGLHNSISTFDKRDALTETAFGVNVYYNFNNMKIGVSWTENRFSLPFKPDTNDPSKLYDFAGSKNSTYSIHYQATLKEVTLYGETSLNSIDKYAIVQGINLRLADRLAINMLYRNYSAGYTTFHGRGPGSATNTNNEEGIFGNLNFELHKHLFVIAGVDISHSHWLSYRANFPSNKIRQEAKLKYQPSDAATIELSYGYRYSENNSANKKTGMSSTGEMSSHTYKALIKFMPSDHLTLSSRLEYKNIPSNDSKGRLLLQDVSYNFTKMPASIWFRFCIFNTTDWNSRLYVYENDMLYNFSVPALSGVGSRSYLMFKYSVGRVVDLRIKYSITSLLSNNTSADVDELKLQLKIRF